MKKTEIKRTALEHNADFEPSIRSSAWIVFVLGLCVLTPAIEKSEAFCGAISNALAAGITSHDVLTFWATAPILCLM